VSVFVYITELNGTNTEANPRLPITSKHIPSCTSHIQTHPFVPSLWIVSHPHLHPIPSHYCNSALRSVETATGQCIKIQKANVTVKVKLSKQSLTVTW